MYITILDYLFIIIANTRQTFKHYEVIGYILNHIFILVSNYYLYYKFTYMYEYT